MNGQAEAVNKVTLQGLKKKFKDAQRRCIDELNSILWPIQTTTKEAINQTPFMLAYGLEVVFPAKVPINTHWLITFQEK